MLSPPFPCVVLVPTEHPRLVPSVKEESRRGDGKCRVERREAKRKEREGSVQEKEKDSEKERESVKVPLNKTERGNV